MVAMNEKTWAPEDNTFDDDACDIDAEIRDNSLPEPKRKSELLEIDDRPSNSSCVNCKRHWEQIEENLRKEHELKIKLMKDFITHVTAMFSFCKKELSEDSK